MFDITQVIKTDEDMNPWPYAIADGLETLGARASPGLALIKFV